MKDKFILSRELICSALYLRLSPSAQALYIALHADADDDGIVDAFAVMLRQRAAENDLKQLVESNFVILLDAANMVVWLCAWLRLNLNRDLRYIKPSKYRTLLAKIVPEAEVIAIKQNTQGKKYREIVPVSLALTENKISSKQEQLLTRRIPPLKSSRSQDKYTTCLDLGKTFICPDCNGRGIIDNIVCCTCKGTGNIIYNPRKEVK